MRAAHIRKSTEMERKPKTINEKFKQIEKLLSLGSVLHKYLAAG